MLAIYSLRQTSRRLVLHTSRSTFSALPHARPNKTDAPANDLLEVKRIEDDRQNERTSVSTPVVTSSEKFAAGLSPIQPTSSMTPTGGGLFQDAKLSNTPISPGLPITAKFPTINNEELLGQEKQTASSGVSAFLRGIRLGLPFFPPRTPPSSPIDLASTREYYIPLTRPSLIRLIATDTYFIDNGEDRLSFHQLCQGFDSAVVQRYHSVLNELKHLFNPLNPDNETLDARRVSYRDRLDNEYWLIQKMNDILHRANFSELPRDVLLNKFILHQDSLLSTDINIQIDGHDYDVLKFWILGREQMPNEGKSWWKKVFRKANSSPSRDYFKRVILAVRLKGQDRLYLKAFRDIPLQNLTQLLPVGKLQRGNFEQQLVRLTFLLGATTVVTHLFTTMASYPVPGLVLGGSGLTVLLGLWTLRSTYQSKINYLSSMSRSLFYKNVASNKQLLAMIIDRAEDELSKEVLLVYMFILWKQKQNINLTTKNLELEIENWVRSRTNTDITFNSDQSVEFLRQLGIILPDDSSQAARLQVLPFKQVVAILPKVSRTLSEKNEEWDLVEGYDKKYFELDWKTILHEDNILNKGGWR